MSPLTSYNATVLSMIRSNAEPVDPSSVQEFLSGTIMELNVQVALAALLVYDTVTNMDKEVKHFWASPLSILLFVGTLSAALIKAYPRNFVSLVYFSNRLIGLFGTIAHIQCKSMITVVNLFVQHNNIHNSLVSF
ncbi:hypothetical protein M0805_008447 [Coniferiporia weirii]|nr:hypothetical protein M0805_008447 [Coniferiporia weirii]